MSSRSVVVPGVLRGGKLCGSEELPWKAGLRSPGMAASTGGGKRMCDTIEGRERLNKCQEM